ncbi:hypothetical protein LSAT2_032098, partial [Lamellibrachia satsuma]
MSIATNLLAIVVIARYSELRQDRTTLFMLSLSVSDLATGCLVMPVSAALCTNTTPDEQTQHLTMMHLFFMCWFGFISFHSLTWVAVSKTFAILKPFRYEQLLTRRRCFGIIAFNWVAGAILAATKLTTDATWFVDACVSGISSFEKGKLSFPLFIYVVSVAVPGVVIVYTTVRIFVVIRRTHSRITAQVQSVEAGHSGLVTLKAIRSARNVLVICFVAIILTIPITVFAILRPTVESHQTTARINFFVVWLFNCNA